MSVNKRIKHSPSVLMGFFIIIFFLLSSIAEEACAGAYKSWGIGVKSVAKGGAFIGQADDWTAIYWNPSGLSQLKGKGFGFEPGWLYVRSRDANSARNYDTANYSALQGDTFLRIYPSEPANFDEETTKYFDISPSSAIGGYICLEDYVVGFGVYTPAGLSTDWKGNAFDTVNNAGISASYFSCKLISAYNVSVAKQINPSFSVGLGLNYINVYDRILATKAYTSFTAPGLNYTFDYKEKAFGDGIEMVGGFMYRFNEKLSVGTVYRSGAKITSDGKADSFHTGLGVNETSDYTQTYYFPSSYGIGFSYKHTPKLLLTLDWERTNWKKLSRKLDFDLSGGTILEDVDTDMQWDIADQVAVGVEYMYKPELTLLAGVRYDETPLSDETVSVTNVVDLDKIWFMGGVGYKKDDLKLDLNYGFTYAKDSIQSVDYEVIIHTIMFGARYNF